MKRVIFGTVILTSFFLFARPAGAEVPATLTYSGHLTSDDLPVDGTSAMVFELYEDEAGGSPVWSETESSVAIDDGMFTVELGDTAPLAAQMDGATYWLQVTVDAQALLPRTPFRSVPYALKSGASDELGGYTASELMTGATPAGGAVTYDNAASGLTAANVQAALDELTARIAALETENAAQQTAIEANATAIGANATAIAALETAMTALETAVAEIQSDYITSVELAAELADYATTAVTDALDTRLDAFDALLAGVTRVGTNLYFSGLNMHVRSGSGSTYGTVNGLGNLIVGYDEARPTGSNKTGSHNLIVGTNHNYSSFGGLVAGYQNTVSGQYSSVSGGHMNTASGYASSVSGGYGNECYSSGHYTWIGGGEFNRTDGGDWDSAGGAVSGGQQNTASGYASSVSGGRGNTASGYTSSVSGGYGNECLASGYYTWIGGGESNQADGGDADSAGGSVSGGRVNTASGYASSVSGGYTNTASSEASSVSGGQHGLAFAAYSSVSGGNANTASGYTSSVSGGNTRSATGDFNWVAGALLQGN